MTPLELLVELYYLGVIVDVVGDRVKSPMYRAHITPGSHGGRRGGNIASLEERAVRALTGPVKGTSSGIEDFDWVRTTESHCVCDVVRLDAIKKASRS